MEGEATVIESGRPIVSLGDARLGCLCFACDGSIAGQVWGAGAALGRHLLQAGLPSRPTVVEIGSGTGVAGLAAAVAGASAVTITDLASVVPRLEAAIAQNAESIAGAEVHAAPLEWGDLAAIERLAPSGAEVVLAADCLYSGEASVHAALRATFIGLAKPCDGTILHA